MSVTQPDTPPAPEWEDAFAELCGRHRTRLIRWLTSIFGPRDAEDIAQEALVRLFLRPGLVEESGEDRDVWPWLAVVARNVGRDMIRYNAQSTAVDHLVLAEVPDEVAVWDQVIAHDDAERLARALRTLSSRDRALIRLRDLQDVPINEVAAMLGVNDNAARQQLFRARKRLADAFTALGGDRQLGLLGTLGLRVREMFRRHWNALEALGLASPAMLAALAPCLACLAGAAGAAVFGTPHAAPVAMRTLAGPDSNAFADAGHGTGGSMFGTVYGRPPAAPRAAAPPRRPHGRPSLPEVHQHPGPASLDLFWDQQPLGRTEQGPGQRGGVYVDLPVVGRVGLGWDSAYGPGDSIACYVGLPTCT